MMLLRRRLSVQAAFYFCGDGTAGDVAARCVSTALLVSVQLSNQALRCMVIAFVAMRGLTRRWWLQFHDECAAFAVASGVGVGGAHGYEVAILWVQVASVEHKQ